MRSNAVKFTEPGGLVNLTVRNLGAQAELMVSDTGVGISPEFLPMSLIDSGSRTVRLARQLRQGMATVDRSLAEAFARIHGARAIAADNGHPGGTDARDQIESCPATRH